MWKRSWIAVAALAAALCGGSTALAAETKESKFDMSKGAPTWSSGNSSLTFNMFAQIRFTAADQEQFDADTAGPGLGREDGFSTGFKIPRVRLGIKGTIYQPWVRYAVSYELSDTTGDKDAKFKDAYLEFGKVELATVRAGQFKMPFGLQELAPDSSLLFPERAITSVFAPSREQGAALMGLSATKRLGYTVAAGNGSGESKSQDDAALMYLGRAWWDPFGEYKLGEGTLDAPDKNLLHVGAAYRTGEPGRGYKAGGAWEDPNNQDAWGLELAWKWRRWYAAAEYYSQATEATNSATTVGSDVDSDGWYVQGAFAAVPQKLEFGARYAEVDGDTHRPDGKVSETRIVANYYWSGNGLKLHFDVGTLAYQANAPGRIVSLISFADGARLVAGDVTDKVARLQLQFSF